MRILRLESQNVKRLEAVEIKPSGAVVTVAGENGAGKSSVLDSIFYALGGAGALPSTPVRKGEEKAVIELDLGEQGVDLVVRRVCSATGGTSLVVKGKDGAQFKSPQGVLDAMVGRLTFDPLDFSRQGPEKQAETLRALSGVDVTKIDAEAALVYQNRTFLGREVKSLEAQVQAAPQIEAPAEEVSTVEIMEEMRKASEINQQNAQKRALLATAQQTVNNCLTIVDAHQQRCAGFEEEIKRIQNALVLAKQELGKRKSDLVQARSEEAQQQITVGQLVDADLEPFHQRIKTAETTNALVRQNTKRADLVTKLTAKRKEHDTADKKLESLDQQKKKLIQSAKLPIDGLAFEAGQVFFNQIPFAQLSSAEQLRISVAVGIALNPKLRVLLIRDGSLLDEKSMKLLSEMAEKSGSQVWMEVVKTSGECSVMIEDGRVKGAAKEQSADLIP